ncbi:MAG: SDR family NAD(P)-dependent oxidoreductase [Alphaproteobacteria bacterium]|nr:SDR family NAD(P)-dependent oxidoreductase [Alphaproteobacteria bacterium]
MKDFAGKTAVITGGGTGMGRELAKLLVAEGCNVAMCDVTLATMEETKRLALKGSPQGTKVATFQADVSIEPQMQSFAQTVKRELDTDKIHLLFNNAGIGGGGSFVTSKRSDWERTFNICWGGVYYTTRAFLPMLMAASEAHIINTSSVNGFWASIGPGRPHTAYAAAKFAVKGFTEALMTDLAVNAPHIKCSVVMPGHIGTEIAANSMAMAEFDSATTREMLNAQGLDVSALTDAQIIEAIGNNFRDTAPTSAAQAAQIILDGVKSERWRILVGEDAKFLDSQVRKMPEEAYTQSFYEELIKHSGWRI